MLLLEKFNIYELQFCKLTFLLQLLFLGDLNFNIKMYLVTQMGETLIFNIFITLREINNFSFLKKKAKTNLNFILVKGGN